MDPLFLQRNRALIIDFSNLVARIGTAGVENDAQFFEVLIKIFLRFRKIYQGYDIVIALEGTGRERRRKLYSGYKKNARTAASVLDRFRPLGIQFAKTLKCTILQPKDGEADDAIATWVHKHADSIQAVIISEDHDLWQLIRDPFIEVFAPRTKRRITEAEVLQDLKIHPNQIRLWKALLGDQSDNIPKAPGMTKKLAVRICDECLTPKRIFRLLKKKKLGVDAQATRNLRRGKKQIFLNYKLVKLDRQVRMKVIHKPGNLKRLKRLLTNYSIWAFDTAELQNAIG